MDQIVSAEDEASSGTASSSSCKPLEDQKSLKQFTLRKFFAPQHPESQNLAAKPTPPHVGRPLSRAMKELMEKLDSEEAARRENQKPARTAEECQIVLRAAYRAGPGRPQGSVAVRRSLEIPVARKAAMCNDMKSVLAQSGTEKEMLLHAKKKWQLPLKQVKDIWRKRSDWSNLKAKHKLSADPVKWHSSRGARRSVLDKRYKGFRRVGAGRKFQFPEVMTSVKHWFETSRSHGLTVLPRHLLAQWQLKMSEAVKQREAALEVTSDKSEQARLDLEIEAGKKTLKIAESANGSKNRIRALMHFLDAKLLKPDLVTKLSPEEEQVRAQLTWQALDHMLWKAVFGPVSGLQGLVCDPEVCGESDLDLLRPNTALD